MKEDLSGLDLIGLLDRLEPVPEPAAVSFWPQTEAWLWIGLVAVGLALWLIRRAVFRRHANAYRRAALREIATAADSPAVLAGILRRTALAAFPRGDVAGLYGDEWLAFLDRTGGLDRTGSLYHAGSLDRAGSLARAGRTDHAGGRDFRDGAGRDFARAPYSREPVGSGELTALAIRWVRGHRRDAGVGS